MISWQRLGADSCDVSRCLHNQRHPLAFCASSNTYTTPMRQISIGYRRSQHIHLCIPESRQKSSEKLSTPSQTGLTRVPQTGAHIEAKHPTVSLRITTSSTPSTTLSGQSAKTSQTYENLQAMRNHAVIDTSELSSSTESVLPPSTFTTSSLPSSPTPQVQTSTLSFQQGEWQQALPPGHLEPAPNIVINISSDAGSTGKGILIGILSAFGSAGIAVLVLAIFFFFKYTSRGRIILDRIGRPGEYDDEQAFAREEAEALETMDELQRAEYLRAKGKTSMG